MSDELLKALESFEWNDTKGSGQWRIHYDPKDNGSITVICDESQSTSTDPYIEVKKEMALSFIEGTKYTREYHVVNNKLELKTLTHNVYKASDARVGQLDNDSEVTLGVYFVTVKGEPDLVIDTIDVNEENQEVETQRIKEYLENNDVYKDSE